MESTLEKKTPAFLRILRIYKRQLINSAKFSFYYSDLAPMLLGMISRDCIAVFMIYFITERFYDIGGWDGPELLFLYCLLYISYGLSMLFFAGVRYVEDEVNSGRFDRYLVTPVNVFFQAVIGRVDLLTTVSYCTVGIGLFIYSSDLLGIIWTAKNISLLVTSVIGGMFIQSAFLLLGSIFSFWAVRVGMIRFLLFFNLRRLAVYPIHIYPLIVRILLIFIVPFAFANYYPATYILEKAPLAGVIPGFFAYGSIIVGVIAFTLVFILWNIGIKNYKSTGN